MHCNLITKWLLKQNDFTLIICTLILSYIAGAIALLAISLLGIESIEWLDPAINNSGKTYMIIKIISAILLAPIIETFFFQKLPYEIAYNKGIFLNREILFIIFFSVIFGLIHVYSPSYMIYAFAVGISLMYGYIVFKNNERKAFQIICITHLVRNVISIIIQLNKMYD